MSLPKTGLRKISVREMAFVWTIRKSRSSSYRKTMIAAIQLDTDSDKGLLRVDFRVLLPGNVTISHKTSVTPKTIELALEKGWEPAKKGTFKLSYPLEFVPDPEVTYRHEMYLSGGDPE